MQNRSFTAFLALTLGILVCGISATAAPDDLAHPEKSGAAKSQNASTDATQSPDARAEAILSQLTLDEKISLLHGNGMANVERWQMPLTPLTNGGAGYVEGIPHLGIPALVISDAAYGVRS